MCRWCCCRDLPVCGVCFGVWPTNRRLQAAALFLLGSHLASATLLLVMGAHDQSWAVGLGAFVAALCGLICLQ